MSIISLDLSKDGDFFVTGVLELFSTRTYRSKFLVELADNRIVSLNCNKILTCCTNTGEINELDYRTCINLDYIFCEYSLIGDKFVLGTDDSLRGQSMIQCYDISLKKSDKYEENYITYARCGEISLDGKK
ncbi:MAG: hypothetical protein JKY53_13590 [Flavobacteriales bacterium]|nr:hypothetical protein [Flavobacteriales bacterium]